MIQPIGTKVQVPAIIIQPEESIVTLTEGVYMFCLRFCSTMLHIIINKQNNGMALNNSLVIMSTNVIL